MRQRFETESHLAREREVREKLERIFGCVCHKLPIRYEVDYAMMYKGRIERFAEVKCREVAYDPFWISLAKYKKLAELGRDTPLLSLLVVQWPEQPLQAFTVPRNGPTPPLHWGGRAKPRDDQDSEPMVALALERFQNLEEQ